MVELRISALPYSPAKSESCCEIATRNRPRWRARRASSLTHSPVARRSTSFHASSITRIERPGNSPGSRSSRRRSRWRSIRPETCSASTNITAAATSLGTLRVSNATSGASTGTLVGRSSRYA